METGLGWDPDKNTVLADDSWSEEKVKVSIPFLYFRYVLSY